MAYERGKIKLHPEMVLKNLPAFEEALAKGVESGSFCPQDIGVSNAIAEVKEMVLRNIAQKPGGDWIAGPAYAGYSSARCPCCGSRIRSGKGSSSRVRDDRCRKCGQLIDWN